MESSLDPTPNGCLDPSEAAAFVDGEIDGSSRQRIHAHLASCADCCELIAGIDRTLTELDTGHGGTNALPKGETPRRVLVRRWLAVAAIAAGIVLVAALRGAVDWWGDTSSGNPHLATVAAAAGPERPIDARLSGGFPYQRLAPVTRSGVRPGDLRMASAIQELEREGVTSPSAQQQHALGIARILAGEYDAGITVLEAAAERRPDDVTLLSDVGAAYLARGVAQSSQADLQVALRVIDRALLLRSEMAEAVFNKAVILEHLKRTGEAADAWDRYLAIDPSSAWAFEARARRDALLR